MTTPAILQGYAPPSSLKLPKAFNFLNPIGQLADTTNLAGLYMFGGDDEACLFNFANPDLPLTKIGSPTVTAAGGVSGDWQNGYETGIHETAAMTVLAVIKPYTATNGSSLLNNGAFDHNGVGPVSPVGVTMKLGPTALNLQPQSGVSVDLIPALGGGSMSTSDYGIAVFRLDATNADISWTRNGTRTDSSTGATGSRPTQDYRTLRIMANFGVGSGVNGGYDTIPNLLMLAIWAGTKLSDGNRNTTITNLRSWFNAGGSGLGITTL